MTTPTDSLDKILTTFASKVFPHAVKHLGWEKTDQDEALAAIQQLLDRKVLDELKNQLAFKPRKDLTLEENWRLYFKKLNNRIAELEGRE